jgi:hypothetical protein
MEAGFIAGRAFISLFSFVDHVPVPLFHYFVAKFLDHGIGKDFPGHALDLLFGGFASHAIQIEDEELTLADVAYLVKSQGRKGMLYGLALRIEDGSLWHHPHVCFHGRDYSKPRAATPV